MAADEHKKLADALGLGPARPMDNDRLRRVEWWAIAAFVLFGTLLVMLFYMGQRQGGRGPIWVFRSGRPAWVLAALLLALGGLAWSLVRRPFLQRRRGRAFLCCLLTIGIGAYPLRYPSSHEGHPSSVRFRLPVEGTWRVLWGGEGNGANLLAVLFPERCFGLHLVREEDGSRLRPGAGDPGQPSDYLAYDEPVVAPADGEVVHVEDGHPDAARDVRVQGPAFGNHVVLEVAEREYLFVTHLRAGSFEVAPGERVTAGAVLARVGFSGRFGPTQEPHVAVHLQDTPDADWGEGIPWSFHDYEVAGKLVERGRPRGGSWAERIRHAPPVSEIPPEGR